MAAAGTLKALGLGILVVGAVGYMALGGVDENPAAILGALAMVVGVVLYVRGRQHAARSRAARIIGNARPHVVYLRSFQADSYTTRQAMNQGLTTEEEQLADVLRPFGDLVAIGRPGESLPPAGAARFYASDSEWQDVVRRQVAAAPLVLIRAGVSDGLLWELEHVIGHVDPRKVIVWIMDLRNGEYATFRAQAAERLGIALPPVPAFGVLAAAMNFRNNPSKATPGFIRFSRDWQPTFLPMPAVWMQTGFNDLRKAFSQTLRPVFEESGVPWRPRGRFG